MQMKYSALEQLWLYLQLEVSRTVAKGYCLSIIYLSLGSVYLFS